MAQFFKPQRRKVADSRHQAVKIERLDSHGAGIALQKGKPLFIEGALPGEEVLAQVTEQKRDFGRGKLIKVLKASDARLTPFCEYANRCGGCSLQHMDADKQREHKQAAMAHLMTRVVSRTSQAAPELAAAITSAPRGYRRSARLSVWLDKQQQLQIGFRQKGSKAVVDISHCDVLDPQLSELIPELKALLISFGQPRALGHVELIAAENGRVVYLRHTEALKPAHLDSLLAFAKQHDLLLFHSSDGTTVHQLHGAASYYVIDGQQIHFLPGDFIQVNAAVNQAMVTQALAWLAPKATDRVLDLFCGLGNFSLPLAAKVAEVVGVEGVEDMVTRASANAAHNQLSNVHFYQANLEQDWQSQPWAAQAFDLVLLDPARAGAAGIMSHIVELAPKRVVYVSCNPATLARDAAALLDAGYTLDKLGMMDMFPNTGHTESMALFVKV
uniref:23S rRNA (uracil(1939)-C(5))-methyltransferase RlmD n=1 Tax=Thaumasiovibrio occultus TaxID=1891184 RepID=UPI000B350591|nr:23S rRNA (uracil(1939)-C(5))-methyltransferase RlmD [Thaumasiovibrio occultus]